MNAFNNYLYSVQIGNGVVILMNCFEWGEMGPSKLFFSEDPRLLCSGGEEKRM